MRTERCIYGIGCQLFADGDDTSPKEFQVLKVGTFMHPRYGKVDITTRDLAELKKNFDARVRGIDIQANYEHGESVAHGTKAAGWIQALSLRNEGKELWAKAEWTPAARSALDAKEWKYSSAEIDIDWKHPESGAVFRRVLKGVALTNVPFIKGMEAIAANEHKGDPAMNLNEIKSALLSEHGIDLGELQRNAGLVDGLQAQTKELSDAVKAKDEKIAGLEKANGELKSKVELSEKQAYDVRFSALVEKGMKEGKLTKAFADGRFKEIAEKNGLEFAEQMLADLPKVVPTEGEKGNGGGTSSGGGQQQFSDAAAEVNHKATELASKENISFSEAVSRVFKAEPKLQEAYEQLGR